MTNPLYPLGPIARERPPLCIARAEGAYLYDTNGRRYLDLTSGLMVNVLGHRHPGVIRAITRQMQRHLHVMVYGVWPAKIQRRWARRLKTTLPDRLRVIYPTNSGAEAVEGALKTAYVVTGRRVFVTFEGAYHGETQGALAVIGAAPYRTAFQWVDATVRVLPWNDPKALSAIDTEVAAVIIEPLQGEGGIRRADAPFWKALVRRCRATGTLLIFDEVQTGMGRTGAWWMCQRLQITPDILVAGKALGGGLPLGAFILRKGLADALLRTELVPHLSTFGGYPLACATSMATIRTIQRQRLIHRIQRSETILRRTFRKWMQRYPGVLREARGLGLMWGLEFHTESLAQTFIDRMRTYGYLMDQPLFAPRVVRFAPPYILSGEEWRSIFRDLERALRDIANSV